jgi:hypothetical protein
MKKNLIDINNLRTPFNYAKDKGVSKQRIYELMGMNRFDVVEIDGTKFILLNKKASEYRSTK